jgi:hypothetical protein
MKGKLDEFEQAMAEDDEREYVLSSIQVLTVVNVVILLAMVGLVVWTF